MTHPYAKHNEHAKSKSRVGHILKDEPHEMKRHADRGAFSDVKSKSAAVSHEHKVAGKKSPARFARGGKVKGKHGHQTNIAIVVPHRQSSPMAAGPQAGAVPPMAGPSAAPALPMGGPPGAGGPPGGGPMPGGPPMPPPMRARGGKVVGGEATPDNLKKWGARASANSYARGGAAHMTAGAQTGVGRLEQAHHKKK